MGTIKEFRQYFTTFALSKHQRCVMIRKLSLSRPSRLLTRIIKLEKNLVGKCGAILDDTGSSIAYGMMGAKQSICYAGTTDKTVFMNTVFTKMSGIQSDGCASQWLGNRSWSCRWITPNGRPTWFLPERAENLIQ